jgi:protein TonB
MYNGRFRIMLAHHHGPYKQSVAIAVVVLIAIFVFFPPLEFRPYTLQAEEFEVVEVPDFEIPPPPPEVPQPNPHIEIAEGEEATTDNVPETSFRTIDDLPIPLPPSTINRGGFVAFDEPPVPEHTVKPVYPKLAREAGIEGTVHLKVFIGLDHRVHQAVVLGSDVTPAMERAAVKAALQCRYKPARQGSIEVEVWTAIRITFRLNE